jgi:hypothetical protein
MLDASFTFLHNANQKIGFLNPNWGSDLKDFKSPLSCIYGFLVSVTLLDGYLVFRICLHSNQFVQCFSLAGY